MLPDIGATELMVIAAVALIVVGPKDLPVLLRRLGQALAKMRGLAADFRASFDEMARQSELDELRKEVEALRNSRFTDPLGPLPEYDDVQQTLYPTEAPETDSEPERIADEPYALPPGDGEAAAGGTGEEGAGPDSMAGSTAELRR